VAGADAILLIADALSTGKLSDLMILATQLTLSILLEVHDAERLLEVRSMIDFPEAGYSVLGINNRNLTTMEVNIDTFGRLASMVEDHRGLVAESGIKTRDHVNQLRAAGATAVLIGQTLCEQPDIAQAFTALFGGPTQGLET
jgi:indole-3-glycerol phosphate synthase